MEYKRLKEKLETILTLPELPFEDDLTAVDCKQMYDILCKIEQGTLIELNDKLIGESVYGIQQDTSGKYWFDSDENTLLGFTSNGIVTWNDVHGYNDWFKNGFWFFTREEAEKRLKELQE